MNSNTHIPQSLGRIRFLACRPHLYLYSYWYLYLYMYFLGLGRIRCLAHICICIHICIFIFICICKCVFRGLGRIRCLAHICQCRWQEQASSISWSPAAKNIKGLIYYISYMNISTAQTKNQPNKGECDKYVKSNLAGWYNLDEEPLLTIFPVERVVKQSAPKVRRHSCQVYFE